MKKRAQKRRDESKKKCGKQAHQKNNFFNGLNFNAEMQHNCYQMNKASKSN